MQHAKEPHKNEFALFKNIVETRKNINLKTVRAWIDQGKLKSFKLGELVRIHEDDLQALIDDARKRQ